MSNMIKLLYIVMFGEYKMYIIKKSEKKIECFDDKEWEKAEIAEISTINWLEFSYKPYTYAKIMYSDYGIHVQMITDENPLLARETQQNSGVCKDSCMELFIRPNSGDDRYLNLEFNPFGTMYFGLRTSRFDGVHPEKSKEYFDVKTYVSDKEWKLQFTIPFELINETFGGYTKTMYGNMYKCSEDNVSPHFVTYYPVSVNEPDFHRPEYFGEFVLE